MPEKTWAQQCPRESSEIAEDFLSPLNGDGKNPEEIAPWVRLMAMGGIASALAHELSQPLSTIAADSRACVRLVQAGSTQAEELVPALNRISRQAQRAGELVRSFRHLLERGEPHRSSVTIHELVQESQVDWGLDHHQVKVQMNLPKDLPILQVDRMQMGLVLVNLVRNALDALTGVAPEDRLLTIAAREKGQDVEMSVGDTGQGLPRHIAKKLFQPFQTTKPHGLGLGLALCRFIVEAHGGRLWAQPNEHRGTTFFFTIPL